MNLLSRFSNAAHFRDYNDFYNHFQLKVPANFNFAYDVVDEYARLEPESVRSYGATIMAANAFSVFPT